VGAGKLKENLQDVNGKIRPLPVDIIQVELPAATTHEKRSPEKSSLTMSSIRPRANACNRAAI